MKWRGKSEADTSEDMENRQVRFWSKVKKTDSCWFWTAGCNGGGRGYFSLSHNKSVIASRYAWQITNGKIPKYLFVLHKCDNGKCVNPAHLFLGTHDDNMRDMVEKNRQASGERNGRAKMRSVDVAWIKSSFPSVALIVGGKRRAKKELAKTFGVTVGAIAHAVKGRQWKGI